MSVLITIILWALAIMIACNMIDVITIMVDYVITELFEDWRERK